MCSAVRRRMLSNGMDLVAPAGRGGGRARGRGRPRVHRGAGAGAVRAARRGRRSARHGGVQHVVAGDAAALAGAGDLRGVEPVLGDQAPHDRRREPTGPSSGAGGGRSASPRARAALLAGAGAGGERGGRRCGRGLGRLLGRRVLASAAGAGSAAVGAGFRGGRRGGGAVASPITARRAPTSTVSPSGTRISVSTPAAGAGTSESTLSVETSNSGSSASTVLADLLEPARDRALGDRLAELRHRDVHAVSSVSAVQAAAGQRERGLAEQLAQRRVGVDERSRGRRAWLPSSPRGSPRRAAPWPTDRRCARRAAGRRCSATIFTRPSVSPMISARPLPPNRCTDVTTS